MFKVCPLKVTAREYA